MFQVFREMINKRQGGQGDHAAVAAALLPILEAHFERVIPNVKLKLRSILPNRTRWSILHSVFYFLER